MYDDFELMLWMGSVRACFGWLIGLLMMGVGLISVRSALPRAGYLVGAAGAMLFAEWCCAFLPNALFEARVEVPPVVNDVANIASVLLYLAFAGLFLAGAVILAREAKARRAGAGGA